MRLSIAILCFAVAGSFNPAVAQPATTDQITWQLKNPFRYFKNPDETARHFRAVHGLASTDASTPIASTERALAKETDGRGWAAVNLGQIEDEACWYVHSLNKESTSAADFGAYISPKSHAVLVQSPVTNGACTWSVGGKTVDTSDCRKLTELQIPYPAGADVTLTVGGAIIATLPIKVVDLLVVGLGDSFGSGEGNPDRPVAFTRGRTVDYSGSEYPRDEFAGFPQRDGLPLGADERNSAFVGKGAGWIHRRCHRSLYSHQLRAALHMAIADPSICCCCRSAATMSA